VDDVTPRERYKNKPVPVPKVRKSQKNKCETNSSSATCETRGDAGVAAVAGSETSNFMSGQCQIYVRTWGCAHNSSDSEYMAGQLAAQGFTITQDKEAADLWLLNSCTVKNPAEERFKNEVNKGLDSKKKVVVAGCVPQGKQNSDYLAGLSMIGVQQIDRVVEVVEETLKGNSVRLFSTKREKGKKSGGAKLDLPKIRRNPLVEIIAINTGCLNQCTYCKTKHARGELGSYPPEEIIARAQQSFAEGVCEIWLTSEDTGAYGRDIGSNLPDLLGQLVKVIPEGCRLRLGMTNPPYILDHLQEMAEILNHDRVYSFLHVPVQSGCDAVLRDMKREYNVADFERVVDYLTEHVPGITIITDIIAGFPTETTEDFEETMDLVRKYKFPSLFINQFFPRPGTPAAKMKRIPTQEVKGRTKQITELFHSYQPYSERLGQVYTVLCTETSHDGNYYVAHNQFYEQILVPKRKELMGAMFEVKIIDSCKFSMTGELCEEGSVVRPSLSDPLQPGQLSGSGAREKMLKPTNNKIVLQSFVVLVVAALVRLLYFIWIRG